MHRLRIIRSIALWLLGMGILSAEPAPDSPIRHGSLPQHVDPREIWKHYIEDCKKESRVWITNRSVYSDGPFDCEGGSLIYQKDELVKLRYYFIVAHGADSWAKVSRIYQETGVVTHGVEYDIKSRTWSAFNPREPVHGTSVPEQPFVLYQAQGKAHPILSGSTRWELDRGLFFDGRHHTDRIAFMDDCFTRWDISQKAHDPKAPVSTVFKGRQHHYAWQGIMQLGDVTRTYTIDAKHKAMSLSTLLPVGADKWFWGYKYLGRVEERLYAFDRSPFDHETGKVTFVLRQGDPTRGDDVEDKEATMDFQTIKTHVDGENPYTQWKIEIRGNPRDFLIRIAWDDGPDFFIPGSSYSLFDIWQAKDP